MITIGYSLEKTIINNNETKNSLYLNIIHKNETSNIYY